MSSSVAASTAQLPSLPDFLMAGGSEQQWLEAQKNGMLNVQADSDDTDPSANPQSGAAYEELLLDPATAEEEESKRESDGESSDDSSSEEDDSSDSDDSDIDDSSEEDEDMDASGSSSKAAASSSAIAASSSGATATASSASNLLDDDELLQSRHAPTVASAGDDSELVEFEIVIDGEVVGSTFLPRRSATDGQEGGAESAEAARAKAEALRNQRKRKFHERMGHVEEETPSIAAIAAAASADGLFIPSGPTICSSCGKEKTKYRCPKCDMGSCSLACVTAHKSKTGCTGVRSRSGYVPLSKMDDRTLQSDVSFLTEMERQSGASKRDPRMKDNKGDTIRITKNNNKDIEGKEASESLLSSSSLFSCTPRHLDATSFTLMAACTQFRAIKYMCMPQGMKMHKENQSKVYALKKANNNAAGKLQHHHNQQINLSPSSSVIRWTLHLIFKHRAVTTDGPMSDMKIIRKRVDERVTWNQVLESILSAVPVTDAQAKPATSEKAKQVNSADPPVVAHMSTALLRHQLAAFLPVTPAASTDNSTSAATTHSNPFSHLRILYAVPFQPANSPVYYSLDLSCTVLQSLAHKVLVEHPVVFVVHHDDLKSYTLEKEPTAPQKVNNSKKKPEAGEREERKKRKVEGGAEEGTASQDVAATPAMEIDSANPAAADSSETTAESSEGHSHGRGGHFNRGGGRGGSGFSHRGGGRGGSGRGGHNNWSNGRGGGRGGRGPHDKSAPPAYSFGVPQQAAAAAKPAPAPTPAPTSTPSLFKKWA